MWCLSVFGHVVHGGRGNNDFLIFGVLVCEVLGRLSLQRAITLLSGVSVVVRWGVHTLHSYGIRERIHHSVHIMIT